MNKTSKRRNNNGWDWILDEWTVDWNLDIHIIYTVIIIIYYSVIIC